MNEKPENCFKFSGFLGWAGRMLTFLTCCIERQGAVPGAVKKKKPLAGLG